MDGDVGFIGVFICYIVIFGIIMLLKCLYIVVIVYLGLIFIVLWIFLDFDICIYRRYKVGDEYVSEVFCR